MEESQTDTEPTEETATEEDEPTETIAEEEGSTEITEGEVISPQQPETVEVNTLQTVEESQPIGKTLLVTDHGEIEIIHSITLGDITVTVSLVLVLLFMILKWFISSIWR